MRRTKIIATLGPASSSPDRIRALMLAGMDVARVNFSHGTREEHAAQIAAVRRAAAELERVVAVVQDLQGPKIRVGRFPGGTAELSTGDEVRLAGDDGGFGSGERILLSLPDPAARLGAGDAVLLDDGRLKLRVLGTAGREVRCLVEQGGTLGDHKGVNLPNTRLQIEALTAKDLADLAFGVAQDVEYVALSFVRSASDIRLLRTELGRLGSRAKVIAKIEKPEALENVDEIVGEADAVMVARGDLGVEIPPEQVPHWQKEIIRRAVRRARPVITATQMLESMVAGPSPTRAEASDVANAVYDGTSAVMLSGETAVGAFPVQAVETMDRICRTTEADLAPDLRGGAWAAPLREVGGADVTEAIASAACRLAFDLGAAAIVAPTQSGATARQVASFRPPVPIVGASADPVTRRQLALVWGVAPLVVECSENIAGTVGSAVAAAVRAGILASGDLAVVTCGSRPNQVGSTDLIMVERVE